MADTYFGFNTTQAQTLKRLMESDDAGLAALATSITNLNTWVLATMTKLNADFTANNGTITGAAFDTDYDTNPQA